MLYWTHPLWQAAATALALYVLYLGGLRFMMRHLGRRGSFFWKKHVFLGTIVLLAWCAGALFGIVAARVEWGAFFITGGHARIGLVFVALAVFSFVSGNVLDRVKRQRFWLPLLHGAASLLLVVLAFVQAWTGWGYLP